MHFLADDDAGKFILRVTVGVTVLFHGIAKIVGGIEPIVEMLSLAGLPWFMAYGVYLGEVVGPALMIAGFYARIGALLVVANMVVAIGLVHMGDVFALNVVGGWKIELQVLMLFGALASALLGPGRWAVNDG